MTSLMELAKAKRELPSKEAALFKAILKFYEHKQYKKGLKSSDQILRKFPDHGETLAMKGLFCYHLDRKEDGHEYIKKGLKNDLTSHICWHVYGLLYRGDKNYEEAVKCYSHALKYDKENIQIIKDYSLLQIHMRNYEGYNETRHHLLALKPSNKQYWVGLAISYHMLQKYDTAVKVLTDWSDSVKESGEEDHATLYENSEMYLYRNTIIEESGDYSTALDDLYQIGSKVIDKKAFKETRARLLLKSGKKPEAEQVYRSLVKENPDCLPYLEGLQACLSLSGDVSEHQKEQILKLYDELAQQYKRSNLIKRMPMKYLDGEKFREAMDKYMRPFFRKGVPSLFVSNKPLYQNASHLQIIEELVIGYQASLKASGHFEREAEGDKEPATAYLWVLYYLAQHYDYRGEISRALEIINEAIAHTPTLVELYMTKARIYKHAGDPITASAAMNEARELDLQDRFVNSKCTKYMLRADQIAEAEKTIALFTRSDSTDPLADLVEMQAMWFALETGASYVRQKQYGRGLKRYHQLEKHFIDIVDDQFDFHSYCLRKMTLRSYIDLLRVEDGIKGHEYYVRGATAAVKVYMHLYDAPKNSDDEKESEDYANMSAADRKKAQRKARKAELKSAEPAPAAVAVAPKDAKDKDKKPAKVDDDIDGAKLVNVPDVLAEATKFLKGLLDMASKRVDCQLLGVEVYLRKKKYLLALRCLLKAHELDSTHPELHRNMVRFHREVHATELDPSTKEVVTTEMAPLYKDKADLKQANLDYYKKFQSSPPHVVAAAQVAVMLEEPKKEEIVAWISKLDFKTCGKSFSIPLVTQTIDFLKLTMKQEQAAQDLLKRAREYYPLALAFKQ
ncbi:hypothetical protein SmJEL517_g03200 [Synchytrium microbalum]|uniref:Uncharacterized protein n=1 Tax=Synchytrium microbalum TaxID=1806994 RepID=A0A507BYV7_9FUNG|nr:uncharacterized protein SmJEL517_g03200 [Synchytrium microbalum]TPX33987.1 hypothetical protein SmJEL517_g03200 [Synchytrium microbalum]